jgi:hypothetical protein
MAKNQNTISWQAPEYKHYEKNFGWYVTFLSIAALIIGFFIIIQKDYFAAVTLTILTGLIIYFSKQTPKIVEIHLTNKGVHHGPVHVPYKQIKHFWVVDNEHHKSINFETATYINRLMVLELEDQDPDEVREFLLDHLPEHEDTRPTVTQRVMHWFKF